MKIGVMGHGIVGGTMAQALKFAGYDVAVYDPPKGYDELDKLRDCEMVFVCVWTPMKHNQLDTSTVLQSVTDLAEKVYAPLIVVRSTIPPGFMTMLQKTFEESEFVFVPEFLIEADPFGSMRRADRIVLGVGPADEGQVLLLVEIMQTISPGAPVVRTTPEEAVMVKLASNGLLAAKVAVANELYDIAAAYGVEWDNVRGAVGLDRRIGPDHLRVTKQRGYGGSCFPKDVQGIIGAAREAAVPAPIFQTIQSANHEMRKKAGTE